MKPQLDFDGPGPTRLVSVDPADAPLQPEVTALERELARRGYTTVLNHYRQALDGLANHKFESANGDLRTTLEDLVTRIALDHTGYELKTGQDGRPRANQGGFAIDHMVNKTGSLPKEDGGEMLHGLWSMTCTNGSHPGTSDADEARCRMQLVTATARLLLNHFPA